MQKPRHTDGLMVLDHSKVRPNSSLAPCNGTAHESSVQANQKLKHLYLCWPVRPDVLSTR